MTDQELSVKDRVLATCNEHPDWTAKQIAESLGIERHHVYNNARAAGLKLAPTPLPASGRFLPSAAMKTLPSTAAPASDFIVFANSPTEMAQAQKAMIAWCDERLAIEASNLEDASVNRDATAASGFSSHGWVTQVKTIERKMEFYEKVKAALQAGYYIVPPFPIDIFAIRTTAKTPRGGWTTRNWRTAHEQSAQVLAAGEGRYVSPDPLLETDTFEESDGKGGTRWVKNWRTSEFTEVDFPFALARGEIMQATAGAMAAKVFDRIGVLPATRAADPIVCGQILMPHRRRAPLTFFVAWWLDTRTL